jgi:riboflavin kinase/FMN adenylyltransferase
VRISGSIDALAPLPRAVAVGTFDGVHRGHQAVIGELVATGLLPTIVTFDPHPRMVVGDGVELLTTLERRLELLAALGIAETLVLPFSPALAQLDAETFARTHLEAIGAQVVVASASFRFGHDRRGDLALLERLGLATLVAPHVPGVSSSQIRRLVAAGEVRAAAALLGRPVEVEGTVVAGDARGAGLGFPTANLAAQESLLVPAFGIYAGQARGQRAAISIGTNPHYGGTQRRIEAFLLDFAGDLYGERVVVELWERLRDEAVFTSEAELVAQIARDVEATQAATRP